MERMGLIAGSGRLPEIFADAARARGLFVHAVAHRGETDPALAEKVDSLTWVRLGQVDGIVRSLRGAGVRHAVMAGGIGRVRALTDARPDLGALRILAGLRSLRDDALLRAVARYLEERGISIIAPTELLQEVLAPRGHLAGPALSAAETRDVDLGLEVASLLGAADVGQTVVLKGGNVLALEAVEGTDEALRRGMRYGGAGAVVVKLCKPGQDERFDLPAVGPATLEVMREGGARVLVVEAGRTVVLDAAQTFAAAERAGISLLALPRPSGVR